MKSFIYNDTEFVLEDAPGGWTIARTLPNGASACVAAGLFAGLAVAAALERAQALVRVVFPVGIKIVGPDTTHPQLVGDMKLVGPDVTHPNFIYWNKDSASFPNQPE